MFVYSKGYEIDGSDTSYSLITPAWESCAEAVLFFLSQKIIDRDTPIVVSYQTGRSYASPKKHTQTIPVRELSLLREVFAEAALQGRRSLTITYAHMDVNRLYPEVFHEVLTHLAARCDVDLSKLDTPVIGPTPAALEEEIYIYFRQAKGASEMWDYVCSEEHHTSVAGHDTFVLEFSCRLGGQFATHIYGMELLRQRFPELAIDMAEVIGALDVVSANRLYDRVYLDSADPVATLERFIALANVSFYTYLRKKGRQPEYSSKTYCYVNALAYLFLYSKKSSGENLGYHVVDVATGEEAIYGELTGEDKILAGIAHDCHMTPSEYIAYVKQLYAISFFSDSRFMALCKTKLRIEGLDDFPDCVYLYFMRGKSKPELYLDLPAERAARLKRLLCL